MVLGAGLSAKMFGPALFCASKICSLGWNLFGAKCQSVYNGFLGLSKAGNVEDLFGRVLCFLGASCWR